MNNKAIILLLLSIILCTPLAAQIEPPTEAQQTEQQPRGLFGRRNNRRQIQ